MSVESGLQHSRGETVQQAQNHSSVTEIIRGQKHLSAAALAAATVTSEDKGGMFRFDCCYFMDCGLLGVAL